jgi:5'-deoxynucleotidase YfbR-like HD superfamily hydrolase
MTAEAATTALITRLRPALARELPAAEPPPFVDALSRQPRAGVTCPGRPRIVLEPPENHAEHCLVVAVYGVLLAPAYGADPVTVFLAGLAHHLHNAAMPDSGFTGEMLLGAHLEPVMARAAAMVLAELPAALRETVERARAVLPDAATPEGRAFHAADVADRVLQIAQHLKAATLTMDVVLGDMELVHDGPVKGFHDDVLRELGLP